MTEWLIAAGVAAALAGGVAYFIDAVRHKQAASAYAVEVLGGETTTDLPAFPKWRFDTSLLPIRFGAGVGETITIIWSADPTSIWSTDISYAAVALETNGRSRDFDVRSARGTAGKWRLRSDGPVSGNLLNQLAGHERWFSLHARDHILLWVEEHPDDGVDLVRIGEMVDSLLAAHHLSDPGAATKARSYADLMARFEPPPRSHRPMQWGLLGAAAALFLLASQV